VEINNYSRELCGGIHVQRTGEIGLFKIVSDSSTGANLRRIEALTGIYALEYLGKKEQILKEVATGLEVEEIKIPEALEKLKDSLKKKQDDLISLEMRIAKKEIIDKFGYKPSDTSLKIIDYDFSISGLLSNMEVSDIGKVGDWIRDYFKGLNTFIVFGNIVNGKSILILSSTEDLVRKGVDCGKIASEIGKKLEGGGGGKPRYAQMGLDSKYLEKAMEMVKEKILDTLKGTGKSKE
jgi:alanyl-tRNA synthetase